jgi:hypothetical protein
MERNHEEWERREGLNPEKWDVGEWGTLRSGRGREGHPKEWEIIGGKIPVSGCVYSSTSCKTRFI